MLRTLLLVLLLANLLFFAWTRGWLQGVVTLDPLGGREPQRLNEQVEPEAIRILRAGPPAAAPSAAASAAAASAPAASPEASSPP